MGAIQRIGFGTAFLGSDRPFLRDTNFALAMASFEGVNFGTSLSDSCPVRAQLGTAGKTHSEKPNASDAACLSF